MEGRRQLFPMRHRELALPAQDFMAHRPVEAGSPVILSGVLFGFANGTESKDLQLFLRGGSGMWPKADDE